MMENMFSSFNPITMDNMSIMWIMMMMNTLFMPMKKWITETKMSMNMNILIKTLNYQFKQTMKKSMYMNMNMMMSIFIMIYLLNTLSLFPYIFSYTAQPSTVLPISISMWMSISMYKMKKFNKYSSHFLPTSTPLALTPFMIIIETISYLIQPLTLSIRLTANITTGHILIILISKANEMASMILPAMMMQMMFSMLELCISIIQAYVLTLLLIMYNK